MRQIFCIFTAIFMLACTEQQTKTSERENETADSATVKSDTSTPDTSGPGSEELPVSKEFSELVSFIDSCGYGSDRARAGKTYRHLDSTEIKIDGEYVLYNVKLQNTPPYPADTSDKEKLEEWRERWNIDHSLFGKVEDITAYFYVAKEPMGSDNVKTYTDGVIEEWEFPDTFSARNAAEELAEKADMVYVNRGAYVCYLDERVYVFHSRAAGFYTPLEKFWKHFVRKNDAIAPNKEGQREGY